MKQIRSFIGKFLTPIIIIVVMLIIGGIGIAAQQNEDGTRTFDGNSPKYTAAQEAAYCAGLKANADALSALSGINAPQDATSGCAPTNLEAAQMGSLVYYPVSMATPTDFYNSVNGKGFNEGYGMQCVAGFKEFMFSLSGNYVAGNAKDYAYKQAQVEPLGFVWHNGTAGLQNGDWAIWTSGQYGHVSMFYNGKWFGQNQYAADPNAGNPFNIASIGTNGIAGYYRPNIYKVVAPVTPVTPENPSVPSTSESYNVQSGDTLGGISLSQGWWVSVDGLYGDSGYAQRLATFNGIQSRGLIYPNQTINRLK